MESTASVCPLCGQAGLSSKAEPHSHSHTLALHHDNHHASTGTSLRLLDIIYKHLNIKVHEADKENVCQQCGHTVVAWDEFAEKCWSVQNDLANNSTVKIKIETDDTIEIALEGPVYKRDDEYEDKHNISNVKSEDPLLDLQSNNVDDLKSSIEKDDNCLLKKRTYKRTNRNTHSKQLGYVCHVCSVETEDWLSLQNHCSREHASKPSVLCVCGKNLKSLQTFNRHRSLHFSSEKPKPKPKRRRRIKKKYIDSEDDDDDEKKSQKPKKGSYERNVRKRLPYVDYKCHLCPFEKNCLSALRRHCLTEHSTSPRVLCICGKYLRSERGLRCHMIAHTTENGLKCDECEKEYLSPYALKSHKETHHRPKEEFTHLCTQCPKKFGNLITLKIHIRKQHENTKVSCDICGLELSCKGSLVSHKLALHDQIKKYVCKMCGRSFAAKVNLINHEYTHGEERNFKCSKCDKTFKYAVRLRRHERTHNERTIKCPQCPALFRTRDNLRSHMATHSDVFRFECKYCGKAFKRSKNLKVHVDGHEGAKEFRCEWCPKSFDSDTKLNVHKNTVHTTRLDIEKNSSQDSFTRSCDS